MAHDLAVQPDQEASGPRIGLALGAGAAKGLSYIGVIEELNRRGFRICAISGCSMGALLGGIYAAGKLDVYRDWVCSLARMDVLRLLDWTLSGGGLIKGERIIETLRELIGEVDIAELQLNYTAVATDIDRRREVWISQGPLFDAIRASIAIPSVFRPHSIDGRRLVDGSLLNPLPVTPLLASSWDYMIAVGVNGPEEDLKVAHARRTAGEDSAGPAERADRHGYRKRISQFMQRIIPGDTKPHSSREPGALELLNQSLDLMQANLAQLRLSACPPDLLIEMPTNLAHAYAFYQARELIDMGRERASWMLDHWAPGRLRGSPTRPDSSTTA
jgi:NTE family protein